MKSPVYLITILLVSFSWLVGTGVALADPEAYPAGTKLLYREYDVPVTTYLPQERTGEAALPASFDWGPLAQNPLGRNVVGEIRDQGNCGSCWAFGSVAVLESWINALYGLTDTDLSEEVLVSDCCPAGDCSGGFLDQAADWMVSVGTTTETCWPYTGSDGPCSGFCTTPQLARTQSWSYACGNWWTIDINLIKQALVNHGPLVTGMDVYTDFYAYSGGVYRHQTGVFQGGHAVLITGYVDDPGAPGGGYFIAKNSWGASWGPYGGFFAVAYDSNCYFGIESTYYNNVTIYGSGP